MNDVEFSKIYVRLGFSALFTEKIIRTEGINSLRLLGGMNVNRVKSLVKSIRRPGGAAIVNSVSETS